ncbi:antitermination regulator [Arthrobacter sp. PGP41]|uniref:ANTAR domain-containing protein n=1 Tax=unclassified Arthrobacter TaxID=235627 RepID=UPI000CDCC62C|nr:MULTISPECIES: ANTAR domain-containing protein [unclassified Arthrobacter]AUZ33297.1 antitermination regulator [Arthrobacter sp. PGP41]MDT0194796.1 ANTAR domain-containing protein [Arthrobacter sp. AB6]
MHAQQVSAGFPVHRTRVLSGAGDEEAFETKASPPAVAGPLRSRQGVDQRQAPARPAGRPAESGSPDGLVLDLVTGTHSLHDSLDLLAAATVRTVVRATGLRIECGVLVHQPKRNPAATGTSDDVVHLLEWEREAKEGPVNEVLSGGHPVAVLQRNGDFRWPRYSTQLQLAGFGSAMGVRLRVATDYAESGAADGTAYGGIGAALAFFAQDAKAFPLQVIAEARTFAGLAAQSLGMAISLHSARSMATDLRSALDSRTSINVACGVIMAQNRCSYHEAFAILAKASSHRNIKVRLVAEDILERLPEGPPRAHFGH